MTTPDDIALDTASGAASIAITDAAVDEFLAAMEMDDPIFAPGALEAGRRLAPPHLAPKLALYPLYGDFIEAHFGGAVFAKQAFVFHGLVWVGITVNATARVVEKYERRGKTFVVFEGRFHTEDGALLVTERRTVLPIGEANRSA